MDIFFQDPNEIPLPPAEVRILELRAEPWPDKQRVRVYLELTPFQKRPNAEVNIHDPQGNQVSTISVLEAISRKMEFTMHLYVSHPGTEYKVSADIYYTDPPSEQNGESTLPEPIFVDRAETIFTL